MKAVFYFFHIDVHAFSVIPSFTELANTQSSNFLFCPIRQTRDLHSSQTTSDSSESCAVKCVTVCEDTPDSLPKDPDLYCTDDCSIFCVCQSRLPKSEILGPVCVSSGFLSPL